MERTGVESHHAFMEAMPQAPSEQMSKHRKHADDVDHINNYDTPFIDMHFLRAKCSHSIASGDV